MNESKIIDSEQLITEIKAEIEENHYVADIPKFDEVMAVESSKPFNADYLHTAVAAMHQNWKVNPYLSITGGGLKNKAKGLVCKLTKPIVEYTCEQNSRFNVNTVEAMEMVQAFITQHEEDQRAIVELQKQVSTLLDRVSRLEEQIVENSK